MSRSKDVVSHAIERSISAWFGVGVFRSLYTFFDAVFCCVYCSSLGPVLYLLSAPVAEVYFYYMVRRFIDRQRGSRHATFHALTDPATATRFWEMQLKESPEGLHAMLRGWFLPSDPDLQLCRENVAEFFAWNLHNVALANADAWQLATVDAMVEKVQVVTGPFPPGREPRLRCLCYTLEPWSACQKPLIAYLAIGFGRRALGLLLRWHGFDLCHAGRMPYWARPARAPLQRPTPPEPTPIVVLHGVLGLLPYVMLLRQLADDHDGAVLAPVFPHCAVQLEHLCGALPPPHDSTELVASIRSMVTRYTPHGRPVKAAFAAHSLGSSILATICRQAPELPAALAFIDPICFLLPDGRVLRNYLYEPVTFGLSTWFHWLQRYIIADEPVCATLPAHRVPPNPPAFIARHVPRAARGRR